jgi:hypothetical protein
LFILSSCNIQRQTRFCSLIQIIHMQLVHICKFENIFNQASVTNRAPVIKPFAVDNTLRRWQWFYSWLWAALTVLLNVSCFSLSSFSPSVRTPFALCAHGSSCSCNARICNHSCDLSFVARVIFYSNKRLCLIKFGSEDYCSEFTVRN